VVTFSKQVAAKGAPLKTRKHNPWSTDTVRISKPLGHRMCNGTCGKDIQQHRLQKSFKTFLETHGISHPWQRKLTTGDSDLMFQLWTGETK